MWECAKFGERGRTSVEGGPPGSVVCRWCVGGRGGPPGPSL